MAPCLCAPTTHEGSFRCRLHRGLPPLISMNPPAAASNLQKGASAMISSREISVGKPLCLARVRERESLSTATPLHHVSFALHKTSSSGSSSASLSSTSPTPSWPPSPSSSSSSSSSFRHGARPPPARKAVSPSAASPPRSSYPRSSSNSSLTPSTVTSPNRCTTSPSIVSHAAALAIMKHHLHNKQGRSHMGRSSTGYKIGPSRLSQMGRAANCTDEVPVLKKGDCSTPNLPPRNAFPGKTSSFNSGEPQARQSTSMESSRIDLKIHSIVSKFKQSESSCKTMGYKAGSFIVPIVY